MSPYSPDFHLPAYLSQIKRITLCFCLLSAGCGDRTFESLPAVHSPVGAAELSSIQSTPVEIHEGLIYRKLRERGYTSIRGYALFKEVASNSLYDIALLEANLNGDLTRLLITIDPKYQSVIDIMTYDPAKFSLKSLGTSEMTAFFTDAVLVGSSEDPQRDTVLVQIAGDGKMSELTLCCNF